LGKGGNGRRGLSLVKAPGGRVSSNPSASDQRRLEGHRVTGDLLGAVNPVYDAARARELLRGCEALDGQVARELMSPDLLTAPLGHPADYYALGDPGCAVEVGEQRTIQPEFVVGDLVVAVSHQLHVAAAVRNLPAMPARLAVRLAATASDLGHRLHLRRSCDMRLRAVSDVF
jgi:hypothetical protein